MSRTLEYRRQKIREKVEDQHKNHFDPEVGMLVYYYPPYNNGAGGYHTRKSGNLHHTNAAVMYADNVLYLGIKEYYEEARRCLWGVIDAQDTREDSPTFGLWGSFIEEPLDEMLNPDYNLADFNARHLAHILKKSAHLLDDELKEAVTTALYRAAQCSIKRNVSPDYTNISFMSLNTIKSDLKNQANLSSGTIAKLGKNENVTTDVLIRICSALCCDLSDIMELQAVDVRV